MDFQDSSELAEFRSAAKSWLRQHAPESSTDRGLGILFAEVEDEAEHVRLARSFQAQRFADGWAGLSWPTQHGGRGLDPIHEIIWAQEAAGYLTRGEVFAIGMGMGGPTVIAWGTPAQQDRWLPPLLRGDEIWCQLFSEPDAGSDVAGVRTKAVRQGSSWVVNGEKSWTSGAHYSKWGMLLARTHPELPKHAGLTYFILDMQQPGVEVRPLRQMTGGSNFNQVSLTDAMVADANRLGPEGAGWSVAVTTLMHERTSIGALGGLAAGRGIAALRGLLERLERQTGFNPLTQPRLRERFLDLWVRTEVLRFHSARVVAQLAKRELPTAEGSITKLALSRLAQLLANFATDASGPYGTLAAGDVLADPEWATAFLSYPGLRIAGGTDEIMKNLVGERVLGLPTEPRVDKAVPFSQLA